MPATKKPAIAGLKGDIWEDTDPRMSGRRVVVEVAAAPQGQVICRSIHGGRPLMRISKDRMERQSGWRLVQRADQASESKKTMEDTP